MRKLSALLASCLCACMLLFCIPVNAISEPNSLTLHYYAVNEALPLADAAFYIYRVAEPTGDGGYALTADFSQYQVDISNLDWNEAGRLTQLAITLSAYAARDHAVPLKAQTTDAQGNLTFEGLEDGLYLVWGDVLTIDVGDAEWNFTPQPLLLPLPYGGAEGTVIHDMEVDVKYDRFPPSTLEDQVDLTVVKEWKCMDTHPDSVTVQLMRNGIVTDSVELNAKNNWQHTWKDLNTGYVWQITEKDVPEGYHVSIHQEGYNFRVTNTESGSHFDQEGTATTTFTDMTGDLDSRTTNASTNTSEAHSTGSSENHTEFTSNTSAEHTSDTAAKTTATTVTKLPQTGQLWWPVPILAGTGILLFGIGLIVRRKEAGED